MFLVTVIVFVAGSKLLSLFAKAMPTGALLFLSEFVLMAGPLLFMALTGWKPPYKNRREGMAPWSVFILIGITLCISPLLSLLNMISSLFAGNAAGEILLTLEGMPLLLRIFLVAVWPPIVEEYVFRGLFFRGYRRQGLVKAMLVSSLMFGLIHMNFNQFSYAFVIGLVMSFAVEATGTLHASILIHICMNLPSVLMMDALEGASAAASVLPVLSAAADPAAYMNNPAYIAMVVIIIVFLAAAGTPLTIVLLKKLVRANEREDYMIWVLKGGEARILAERPKEKIFDVYLIAAIVICLVFMVLALF